VNASDTDANFQEEYYFLSLNSTGNIFRKLHWNCRFIFNQIY